jgi:hypothetical protein
MAYFNSDKLPVAAVLTINSGATATSGPTWFGGTPDGRRSRSRLETGWTGLAHADVLDGFKLAVELDCDVPEVGICEVLPSCTEHNCRCNATATPSNAIVECDEPGVADADDCGGEVCDNYLGPPLPGLPGGVALCAVMRLDDIGGTIDLGNRNIVTSIPARLNIHLDAGGANQACPTCNGDPTANDGVKGGTCSGGARDTLACDANALSHEYGPTSYDCLPTAGSNLSGAGQAMNLDLSDEPDDLVAQVSCGGALAAFECHCRVCSGNASLPCNTDADCSTGGFGTCSANGVAGASPRPNGCNADSFECAGGQCPIESNMLCDGVLRADGRGMIYCLGNADCDAIASECPGGDCGDCTITESLSCFADTIEAKGLTAAGVDHAVLGTSYCVAPSGSGSVNNLYGYAGPARMLLDMDVELRCDDGTTPYIYGGAGCP